MRCTDVYSKYIELDAQERRELAAAVNAHGGEYVFIDCKSDYTEDSDAPIVLASTHYSEESEDYYVTRVKVNENGAPEIYGFRKSSDAPAHEQRLDYIEFSHVSIITCYIPVTGEVKDVSERVNDVPVKFLTRDDIEAAGFNPDISDEELKNVAITLGKHLDYDDFRLSLISSCEYIGLERLNIEENA
jgi:hypothetical protein